MVISYLASLKTSETIKNFPEKVESFEKPEISVRNKHSYI